MEELSGEALEALRAWHLVLDRLLGATADQIQTGDSSSDDE